MLLYSFRNPILRSIYSAASTPAAESAHLLEKLPYAEHATFNHYNCGGDSLCLPNTRTQVLADIMAWARGGPPSASSSASGSSGSSPRIYWLDGMAGTGKSTIARTVARRCYDEGRLGASFFFSRGGGELETARKLVTSIAVQLAQHSPALRQRICAAVAAHPTIAQQTLHDQWRQLVLRPFQQLASASDGPLQPVAATVPVPTIVVVIDALDECSDEREIGFVTELLSETTGLAVAQLKIFLTSRPEVAIREGMLEVPAAQRQHVILHHILALSGGWTRSTTEFCETLYGTILRATRLKTRVVRSELCSAPSPYSAQRSRPLRWRLCYIFPKLTSETYCETSTQSSTYRTTPIDRSVLVMRQCAIIS
jgi:hypothetical protein